MCRIKHGKKGELTWSAHALTLPLKSPEISTVAVAPISQLVVVMPVQGVYLFI